MLSVLTGGVALRHPRPPFGTPHQVGGVTCRSDAYVGALLRSTPLFLYMKRRYADIFVRKPTMETRVFTTKPLGLQVSKNLLPSGLQLTANPLFAMTDRLLLEDSQYVLMLLK